MIQQTAMIYRRPDQARHPVPVNQVNRRTQPPPSRVPLGNIDKPGPPTGGMNGAGAGSLAPDLIFFDQLENDPWTIAKA